MGICLLLNWSLLVSISLDDRPVYLILWLILVHIVIISTGLSVFEECSLAVSISNSCIALSATGFSTYFDSNTMP